MRDLLREYLPRELSEHVDLDSLERVQGSFITAGLRHRESDLVWRVRIQDQWTYVYLLLEFQSSVDAMMAMRVASYSALLYLDLVKEELVVATALPSILPIVLYNGERTWTAKSDTRTLIEVGLPVLEPYALQARYLLLDEQTLASSTLPSTPNLVSAVFGMEAIRTVEDLGPFVQALSAWLREPGDDALRTSFVAWINRVLLPAHLPGVAVPAMTELEEVGRMLTERVKDWTRQWRESGRQEGREEGREEGRSQLAHELARRALEMRFGPLSDEVLRTLDGASETELTELLLRSYSATHLDELLAPLQ